MASRPPSPVADILLSGASDVALAPYGHHWRQARKLVTAHLLSATMFYTYRTSEITNNTPKGQAMVKEENLHNITYLKAVVKETLRLHPPAPLLLPRISMEKCDINGYTIPAGTHVIVNVWALGRDPMSWDKAHEFMPERFNSSMVLRRPLLTSNEEISSFYRLELGEGSVLE
nr:unnamed protein product [Digitaria exilis]